MKHSLHYASLTEPGYQRVSQGHGFSYRHHDGRPLRDKVVLERIRHLAIPPAWTEVWICRSAKGHIQAIGRDARGRRQYRYHNEWRLARDTTKFARLLGFARALPSIRAQVRRDLHRPPLSPEAVAATVVRLLEMTLIRVGNEEYARTNGSYGLTTLRDRHVRIHAGDIRFHFRGKSGQSHEVTVHDRRLAARVRRLQDLPGQELFQYIDAAGQRRPLTSGDVNAYLRRIAGEEFSAKDFRTWAGTLAAAEALADLRARDQPITKRRLAEVVADVAAHLGNTPAVCRKAYIHPALLTASERDLALLAAGATTHRTRTSRSLSAAEKNLVHFLQHLSRRRT